MNFQGYCFLEISNKNISSYNRPSNVDHQMAKDDVSFNAKILFNCSKPKVK